MKGRREKQIFSGAGYQWEGGGHKERVNEGEYGRCIFISIDENRMKPAEIVLRRGRREEQEQWRG
jgi:hypothetical protein